MKKIFFFLTALLCATGMMAQTTLIDYYQAADVTEGVSLSGSTVTKSVKIHTNTDNINCIQLANGYTTSEKYNGNAIVLHTDGGFKAGDTLTVAGFFNNSDDSKVAKAQVFTVNDTLACTAVWTSEQFINGRTSADEPNAQVYVLEADMDSIIIGRNGNTGTNISTIKVVRPESEEPTYAGYLVGTLAENGWDADKATGIPAEGLTRSVVAGTYEFKVLPTLGSWDGALGYSNVDPECSSEGYEGSDNVKVTLTKDGDVTVKVVAGWICVTGEFGEVVVTGYTIAGAADLMGSAWDPADTNNDMTQDAESGNWELVKENVTLEAGTYYYKAVANHAWGVADYPAAGNKDLAITEAGTYNVTFTYVPGESLTAKAEKQVEPEPELPTLVFEAGEGWTTTAGAQTYTAGGITIATTQGAGDAGQYRVYKSQTFTVSSKIHKIAKLEFTCTANGTAKYGPGNFTDATSGTYTFTTDTCFGTWAGEPVSEITLTASGNQVRFTKLVVTYEKGEVADFTITVDVKAQTIDIVPADEEGYYIPMFGKTTQLSPEIAQEDADEFAGAMESAEMIEEYAEEGAFFKGTKHLTFDMLDIDRTDAETCGEFCVAAATLTWDAEAKAAKAGKVVSEVFTVEPLPVLDTINNIANIKACYDEGVVKDNDTVVVAGYISNMFLKPANFAKYGSVCVWLTDTLGGTAKEFELYNCYGLFGDSLKLFGPNYTTTGTSNIDVDTVYMADGYYFAKGDYVAAAGAIKKYNGTYELNTGCFFVEGGHDPEPAGYTVTVTMNGYDPDGHMDTGYAAYAEGEDYVEIEGSAVLPAGTMVAAVATSESETRIITLTVNGESVDISGGVWMAEEGLAADMAIVISFSDPEPEPEPEPVEGSGLYIVGTMNEWTVAQEAYEMTTVTEGFEFSFDFGETELVGQSFKITDATLSDWSDATVNLGMGTDKLNPTTAIALTNGSNTNISVADGYTSATNVVITLKYVMGEWILSATGDFVEGEKEIPALYLRGINGSWNADEDNKFTKAADKDEWTLTLDVTNGEEFKVADANWGEYNFGGSDEADLELGVAFTLVANGQNLALPVEAEPGNYTFTVTKSEEGVWALTVVCNDSPTTGLQNVEAGKVVKMVENGMVVIIREGKKFNILGAGM